MEVEAEGDVVEDDEGGAVAAQGWTGVSREDQVVDWEELARSGEI